MSDFLEGFADDPIKETPEGFYHWDEIWANLLGPYISRSIAEKKLYQYCEMLEGRTADDPELEELEDFHGCKWQPDTPNMIYLPDGYVLKRLCD